MRRNTTNELSDLLTRIRTRERRNDAINGGDTSGKWTTTPTQVVEIQTTPRSTIIHPSKKQETERDCKL